MFGRKYVAELIDRSAENLIPKAASSGGFYPKGVNGQLHTSA